MEFLQGVVGKMGLINFFWEPTAAGKGGAENMAATRLMREIHEIISSEVLEKVELNF